MKRIYILLFLGIISIMTGCAKTNYNILMPKSNLTNNSSIVLMGIKGKQKVNYLQFESWSKMPPACNYRGIYDNVVALEIDTPQSQFKMGVYTTLRGAAGYSHTGVGYGYITVDSKGISISKRGIYYYGILDTDTQTIDQNIDRRFLINAKKKYKELVKDLKPINFMW
ncbi:MAG: Unknown protein [uncultured Sulfurovum sp.]|uniref:Uncharacterized protein n=1 Tax=uncultured Sulfurovum sp. TaxID=269237 RepID=A0A6S6S5M3_9BACT|nr:MAG: Unknown protein [uncultured Sulfurovum sp.]